jgi:hypothetical protein
MAGLALDKIQMLSRLTPCKCRVQRRTSPLIPFDPHISDASMGADGEE